MTAPTRATKVESRRFVTVLTAALFTLAALLGCGLGAAPAASAIPANCQTQLWGLGDVRILCDGPIRPDGSWTRARQFYTPAWTSPITCTFGTYVSTCFGGTYYPERYSPIETYPVNPDIVLPDEPGHIGPGQLPELR